MKFDICTAVIVVAGLGVTAASAQPAANAIESHLAAAKAAAGFDFTGTLARVCVAPQTGPGADVAPPGLWARRSRILLRGAPLLAQEAFLPSTGRT